MFEEEDEDEFLEIVTLRDEEGNSYRFQVIDELEMDGNDYLIAIPDDVDVESDDEEKLVVIKANDQELTLVQDEYILEKLQKLLEQITINDDIESITLLGKDGKRYVYNVVDRIEVGGQKYILTIDDSNPEDEFIIFKVKNNQLIMVEDETLIDELMEYFNSDDLEIIDNDDEDVTVTLEDENGDSSNFSIMGKLEIKGKNYLIASSPDKINELVAISIDKEDMSLVNDKADLKDINFYLSRIKNAILRQPHPSPESN